MNISSHNSLTTANISRLEKTLERDLTPLEIAIVSSVVLNTLMVTTSK